MLDTTLPGDPAAIRRSALWVREQMGVGAVEVAEETLRARDVLERGWQGEAQTAFHGAASALVRAGDALAAVAARGADEMEALAEALEIAQSRMATLRAEAAAAGLEVTAGGIAPAPGNVLADSAMATTVKDDSPIPGDPLGLEAAAAWQRASTGHRVILDLWENALARAEALVAEIAVAVRALRAPLLMAGRPSILDADAPATPDQAVERRILLAESAALSGLDQVHRQGSVRSGVVPRTALKVGGVATLGIGISLDMEAGESKQQAVLSQGAAALVSSAGAALTPFATAGGASVGSAVAPGPGTVAGGVAATAGAIALTMKASELADKLVDEQYEEDPPPPTAEDVGEVREGHDVSAPWERR